MQRVALTRHFQDFRITLTFRNDPGAREKGLVAAGARRRELDQLKARLERARDEYESFKQKTRGRAALVETLTGMDNFERIIGVGGQNRDSIERVAERMTAIEIGLRQPLPKSPGTISMGLGVVGLGFAAYMLSRGYQTPAILCSTATLVLQASTYMIRVRRAKQHIMGLAQELGAKLIHNVHVNQLESEPIKARIEALEARAERAIARTAEIMDASGNARVMDQA